MDKYRELPFSIMSIHSHYEFDIFMKIQDEYRLFLSKGAPFTIDHLEVLDKGRKKIYAREGDWDKIKGYFSHNLKGILKDPHVKTKVKAEIVLDTSMNSIKDVFKESHARTIADLEKNVGEIIKRMLSEDKVMKDLTVISNQDHFTYQHSIKVGIYATALATKLLEGKLSKQDIGTLSIGFLLHDIGLAKVPKEILDKSGKLTSSEWDLIKKHPQWGYEKLLAEGYTNPDALEIILAHHERHDGSGYPFGKSGDKIPFLAKICAIADAFESLTAGRPYRKPKKPFEALKIMHDEMPHDFDPVLFKSFITILGPQK